MVGFWDDYLYLACFQARVTAVYGVQGHKNNSGSWHFEVARKGVHPLVGVNVHYNNSKYFEAAHWPLIRDVCSFNQHKRLSLGTRPSTVEILKTKFIFSKSSTSQDTSGLRWPRVA